MLGTQVKVRVGCTPWHGSHKLKKYILSKIAAVLPSYLSVPPFFSIEISQTSTEIGADLFFGYEIPQFPLRQTDLKVLI